MAELEDIVKAAEQAVEQADSEQGLDSVRVQYLGKKGQLTEILKGLSKLSPEERSKLGQAANQAKQKVQQLLNAKGETLAEQKLAQKLASETIDITLPGRGQGQGSLHPVTRVTRRVVALFAQMGFSVAEGPEIEDDYHNFKALNIPANHPAKAMHDTFYLKDSDYLLRTHTSPVQIRVMENNEPPLRVITPGRVYRCDSDVRHTPMFHQVEGLMVGEDVTFAHLKGILNTFLQRFFEKDLATRWRPSYFPFTEPSGEIDMQCVGCDGQGCRICSHTGWLEILGCGMVHPKVFEYAGVDSEKYTGFAFGMGLDRLAMLRYQINDLRTLFENDIRMLEQF